MESAIESRVLSSSSGSVSVSLHPLVIMNISDHYTRSHMQRGGTTKECVYGALLGTQKGRSVEICNSFELVVTSVDDAIVLDREYFTEKEEQFRQVFSSMEFLGWYTIGDTPTSQDAAFHEQLCRDRDNSLLLKLNTCARTNQLPVSVYESLIEIVEAQPKVLFAGVTYTLATEDAERVGVDHIARASVTGASERSAVSEQLSAQYGAAKMLHSRVRLVLDYLKSVQTGELPTNMEVLREIASLCDQLPVIDNQLFKKDFYSQTNEVLLMSYLAAITKGVATASEFVSKVNVVYDRHGIGRRSRGLLF
ncbi:COP9 signalosome complex subunit 6-like [Halichondria panicea]|uniref:COP9 signalosome complex subunit 6-like n=1 Tax=Halichondria panicea TaxID=6063 RepID=UPI00312BB971